MAKGRKISKGQLEIDFHQKVPYICAECFTQISEKVYAYSIHRYHLALCWNCQKKYVSHLQIKKKEYERN